MNKEGKKVFMLCTLRCSKKDITNETLQKNNYFFVIFIFLLTNLSKHGISHI